MSTTTKTNERIENLLSQMTLWEKVSLLSGTDLWHTAAIPRLGIPALVMTDGPHGVRADQDDTGRAVSPATSYPTGISMGASWNPELVERVGSALAEETRHLGCHVLLGPCVNIVRSPLGGRNFETYSEDPYLAGRLGVAFVKGVQSKKIGTSLKHFACNNQEIERNRGDSIVDERTLREIYLAQFETVVKEAHPWTVMDSYNRINGTYASENTYTLKTILKGEWGFDGVVVSDWGATHTTVQSKNAGQDIEMPGPAKYYGKLLVDAVRNWQVDIAEVDDSVRRILRLFERVGLLDDPAQLPAGSGNTTHHQALARELAEESITLLKNDASILPIDLSKVKSIAVIGPNAAEARYGGGGSSYLKPHYTVSPLEGLQKALEGKTVIHYELGCPNSIEPPVVTANFFRQSDGSPGIKGEYFTNTDFSGDPFVIRTDENLDFNWWNSAPIHGMKKDSFSVRWTGEFIAPHDGIYQFLLISSGHCKFSLDGELVLDNNNLGISAEELWENPQERTAVYQVKLSAGLPHKLLAEFIRMPGLDFSFVSFRYNLLPEPGMPTSFTRAIELAKQTDLVLFFGGMPSGYESEGHDRPNMELPGEQNALIEAISGVNKNLVVIMNVGAPFSMPWLAKVPGLVLAYYPGQEGGNAIASVLTGKTNPSGKLPETLPLRLEDNPAYINYPGGKEVLYGEGIFVGYRYYDKKDVNPLFPFGYGLSYTSFEYSSIRAPERFKLGETVRVSVTIKNTGAVYGKEVTQLYVADKVSSLIRPVKELKGFKKVGLMPDESQTVIFELDERAFSFYDPYQKSWIAEPGEFEILVGSSSRDIRQKAELSLE